MRPGPGEPVAVPAEVRPVPGEQVALAEVCPTWCSRLPASGGPLESELREIDDLGNTLLQFVLVSGCGRPGRRERVGEKVHVDNFVYNSKPLFFYSGRPYRPSIAGAPPGDLVLCCDYIDLQYY